MPSVLQPNDALKDLAPLTWRGITVPVASLGMDDGFAVTEHAAPDVDGAWLEETGRVARVFSVRCILRNGIVFDPAVFGLSQRLFPTVRNQFVAALRQGGTDDLQHPTEGTLRAKVLTFKESIAPGQRDGSDIDVTFKEDNEGGELPTQESPHAQAYASAVELDSNLALLRLKFTAQQMKTLGDDPTRSFADSIRDIQAGVDTLSNASRRAAGSIDSVVYRAQSLSDSLDRLGDTATIITRRAAEDMAAALLLLQGNVGKSAKQIGIFIVPASPKLTVARLAAQLGTTAGELAKMNPFLYRVDTVSEGARIRYPL